MAAVHLSGSIPMTVVVEDGEVRRVVAHDELFEYERNDEGFLVTGPDSETTETADVEAAHAVAEKSDWPSWSFGW